MSSSKSRRAVRPYVRKGLMSAGREGKSAGLAARLARLAGSGWGAGRASVDPLEPRKLLFTLTIGPGDIDPTTGLGQRSAFFAYHIPYLLRQIPEAEPVEPVVEEFADEDGFWTQFLPAIPPTGTIFNESEIQISYSATGATPILIPGPDPRPDGEDDLDLEVTLSGNGFMTFSYLQGTDTPNPRPRPTTQSAFVIRGLNTSALDGTKVQLLRAGQVVQTLSGAALAAIATPVQGNTGAGNLRFDFNFASGYDAVRFSSVQNPPDNAAYFNRFVIDDISITFPSTQFADFIDGGIFGAEVVFTGPVGASVQILDLYGRDMVATLALGIPDGEDLPIGSPIGRPFVDFNDGIGQIIFRNTDLNTTFTMFGGTVQATNNPPENTRWFEQGFAFLLPADPIGLYDEFEDAGFGYALSRTAPPEVIGLPPGSGSVIIGSPIVRDISNPNSYLGPPIGFGQELFSTFLGIGVGGEITNDSLFRLPNQGIRTEGGASIGSVLVHGIIHGSSRFTGAVGRLAVGTLLGTVVIDGDAGYVVVASDAGHWARDDTADADDAVRSPDEIRDTRNELVVGRTLGELVVGGRSTMNLTVIADVNNAARPRVNFMNYTEREVIYNLSPNFGDATPETTIRQTLNNTLLDGFLDILFGDFLFLNGQAVPFGTGYYRNDSILSAEFVGTSSGAVEIRGLLGGADPVNTGPDSTDVYAFAAGPDGLVVLDVRFNFGTFGFDPVLGFDTRAYARVVDADGRTVATAEYASQSPDQLIPYPGARITFRPSHTDVYYLVLNTPVEGGFADTPVGYSVSITGLLPTTLGGYRTGLTSGYNVSPLQATSVNVQAGSAGLIRVGSGYVGRGGGEVSPAEVVNTVDDDDDLFSLRNTTFSVAGNVYGVMLGSDVFGIGSGGLPGPQFLIGGNLGTFRTGMSEVVGTGPTQGDVEDMHLQVGGTIAIIDIRGAVRLDQDNGIFVTQQRAVNIRSGANGGPGHIGLINVGQTIYGQNFTIRTSPGSIIDAFMVGEGTGGEGDINELPPFFNLGAGSDVRFVSFTRIDSRNDPNALRPLVQGVPVTLTDDSGATFTVEIRGGAVGSAGLIRFLPINGSNGVAVGRIEATLLGGASLVINGVGGSGRVSIGSIIVTTDGGPVRSSIQIGGSGEIDVWQIRQIDGAPLTLIQNQTVGGDIVVIDVQGLDELIIRNGNLGRTQTNGVGPRLIGPFLGVASGYVAAAGGAIGLNPASINPNWNGTLYPPIAPATSDPPDDVTLSDIGGPFGPWLNGMIVRGGNVNRVSVSGSVGDVILQGGNLLSLTANSQGIANSGTFRGIVGVIYANDIGTIDIGDGLADRGYSSLAAAGIFADDDIAEVLGGRNLSPVIRGLIIAANGTADPGPNGVLSVRLTNGRYDGAFIGATTLDSYWTSARFWFTTPDVDDPITTGDVLAVRGTNADLFRSRIIGVNVNEVALAGGAYDASLIEATGNVNTVSADVFRNSTRLGEALEFRRNEIIATRNLGRVFTNQFAGDISDLRIDIQGSLTDHITGRTLTRVDVDVDGTVASIVARDDMRASSVRAGTLTNVTVTNDIRSSSFHIAGRIDRITAGQNITATEIYSLGPAGRIDRIQASGFITGKIRSQGEIRSIISTAGDIIAEIETTNSDGHLHTLQAAGDVRVKLNVAGHVDRIVAGRNVGAQGEENTARAINVRGNLNIIQALGGQIYTDVKVGEGIGLVQQARVVALPGNDLVTRATIHAFGRIATVNIAGDFNGSIISESGGIGIVTITDGSFRPGNQIRANAGAIDQVIITGGHLMGDIIAGEYIGQVRVLPNASGFWGDIGINPNLSQFAFFDPMRNQLPPGVAPTPGIDGPRIQAGTNIGLIEVARASMWETSIYAGHTLTRLNVFGVILNDNITPGLGGSWIVAGDMIDFVDVGQFVGGAFFLAGITDLGADNRPGGVGADADTVHFGRIGDMIFRGGTGLVTIAAGMNAGPDGFYTLNPGPDGIRGTADDINDDAVADGLSSIRSVTVFGQALQTTAYADNGIGPTTAGIIRGGPGLKQQNPGRVLEVITAPDGVEIGQGVPFSFATAAGETGRITFTGPGRAYWNQDTQTLGLVNTTLQSRLIVDTDQNSLTDVRIVSNDGASMGFASIRANFKGNSSFYFDAYVQHAEFGQLDTTGVIGAGNDMGSLVVGPTTRGHIRANYINSILVAGNFGTAQTVQQAFIDLLAGGRIDIAGNLTGRVVLKRDVNDLNVAGTIDRGLVRSGRSLSNITAGAMNFARISSRNDVNSIVVNGNVTDSVIYAGADLGADATFGGTGVNADVVTPGSINRVTIRGNFIRSDIAAGVHRGSDGFLGTANDVRSEGRSTINRIDIQGQAIGSDLNSQSYRIVSTGTIGQVNVGGRAFSGAGNMQVATYGSDADALRVTDLYVQEESRRYTAYIEFNQPISPDTLAPALRISEMRNGGEVSVLLSQGTDYTVQYDAAAQRAVIHFDRAITDRNLPQTAGVPGPGVFRFVLESSIIRGQTQNTLIDGNGDGFAAPGDTFSQDAIVGDVGDKIVAGRTQLPNGNFIDFYGAADLDLVLDNNYNPNGLPDTNKVHTIRGTLGDHPDQDVDRFRTASDADVYKITLRAGQILRLGQMQGVATLAVRALLDANGNELHNTQAIFHDNTGFFDTRRFTPTGRDNAATVRLPSELPSLDDMSRSDNILIKQTGTYYILVTPTLSTANLGVGEILPDVTDPTQIPNVASVPGALGAYKFTLEVFDDGDTGFSADNDSGDGVRVVNAPLPIAFAGNDGVFGTADDLSVVSIGSYQFFLNAGPDGVPNTADDIVVGSNGTGITSERTAGPDGVFGTVHDRVVNYVAAAIGSPNPAGVPREITPDIDVYHLNNREPIAPGTRVRVTLGLTELGSNLGVTQEPRPGETRPVVQDLRGDFQFAIFETSTSTRIDDGLLHAATSEALPVGGQTTRTVTDGVQAYGYDASGDFFIEFIVPGRQGIGGVVPASYAIYVQGAVRTDYTMTVVTQGSGAIVEKTQNVFLETRGGIIDWLEAGTNLNTVLSPFTTSVLGFSGLIGATPVDQYVLQRVISNLDAIFAAANVNIVVANTPAAFEGQPFSTVFLTASNEPPAFAFNGTFGASQRVDYFNLDQNDQAVVFLPSLAVLGNGPSQAGVDALVQSLTASVARRIGELVGLRATNPSGAAATFPVMSSNSVFATAPAYGFTNASAQLSNGYDSLINTNFYLGRQNSFTLLDRILAPRF